MIRDVGGGGRGGDNRGPVGGGGQSQPQPDGMIQAGEGGHGALSVKSAKTAKCWIN